MHKTVLITGANRGIGAELSRHYLANGVHVIGTFRSEEGLLEEMKQAFGEQVTTLKLDVSQPAEFEQFSASLNQQPIDILINNAGISESAWAGLEKVSADNWQQMFLTNTIGPMLLTHALLPNLRASTQKVRIVGMMSSQMGSIDDNTSGGFYMYRSSKAALNAATKSLALEFASDQIACIVLHPGWVKTRMGGSNAPTTPEQSATGIINVLAEATMSDSGTFCTYNGRTLPW